MYIARLIPEHKLPAVQAGIFILQDHSIARKSEIWYYSAKV